jgi:hypothetical protein
MLRSGADLSVASLFDEAAERAAVLERHYSIAGLGVTLRFAGEGMLARIDGSLAHLAAPHAAAPLTIDVWDSASTGVGAPLVLGERLEGDENGPIYYYDRDGVQAIGRWRTLSVLDAAARHAWFWTPDANEMLSWDWAAPLRSILHWWLGRHGVLQIHAGAVGTDNGGVLLVGRGGSGKSTTSLACLMAGLRYAGDDYVAIEPGPEPWVHSLYCSGKLESHQVDRVAGLGSAVANPERAGDEKAVVYAERVRPGASVAGFPLRAVLVPRIVAQAPESRFVPVSAPAALAALAPSTIFQLHPPQPNALAHMAALVRAVPCFSLELGSDIDRIPDAIVRLLESRP